MFGFCSLLSSGNDQIAVNFLNLNYLYYFLQNTRSHMEYAIKLWNSVQSHNISKRCKCFVAALALKQGEAELALSLIENNQNHVTPRFICLIAYTSLGHFHAAFDLLENVIKRSKDGLKSTIGEQMVNEFLEKSFSIYYL